MSAKKIYIGREEKITILRSVRGTDSRQQFETTVGEAIKAGHSGNDFATHGGTVMVSARLTANSLIPVYYDTEKFNCYIYQSDLDYAKEVPAEYEFDES